RPQRSRPLPVSTQADRYPFSPTVTNDASSIPVRTCSRAGRRLPLLARSLLKFLDHLLNGSAIKQVTPFGWAILLTQIHVADDGPAISLVLRVIHQHHPLGPMLGGPGRMQSHGISYQSVASAALAEAPGQPPGRLLSRGPGKRVNSCICQSRECWTMF